MSGKSLACVVLVCDGCGETLNHDYTPHFSSLEEAREESYNMEWGNDGGSDYCYGCRTKPHVCTPRLDEPELCRRCLRELEVPDDAPVVH